VVLTCRSVDRIFLQGYVPKLKSVGLVCRFSRWQRGFFVPSSAAFGKIGDAYVAKVHKFAADYDIPVVLFRQGEGEAGQGAGGPALTSRRQPERVGRVGWCRLGIAQEKASIWRSWKAKCQEHARHPHMDPSR
jgi:hypothetical protein